jgi:hypothetical protein
VSLVAVITIAGIVWSSSSSSPDRTVDGGRGVEQQHASTQDDADGGCLPPATDRAHYSLSAITRPHASIELSVAAAIRPALCASGWLNERPMTTAVMVDIGVNAGYDLAAWFRIFGRRRGDACDGGGVGNFLFVEPQREKYEDAIAAAVDAETIGRARAGLPRLDKVAISFDALGSDQHRPSSPSWKTSGGGKASAAAAAVEQEVNLVGEGEIAIAAIEGSRGLHLLLAAQRAHHQHKRRRMATSRNSSSSASVAAPAPWALQGRRGRKARLTTLPRLLEELFTVAADGSTRPSMAATVDRMRIPFLKIDTEGADATILMSLASTTLFKRQRVGAVVFELNRFAAIFTVSPTHALAMLASEGYECFLVGMAAGNNTTNDGGRSLLLLTAIRVDPQGRRDWGRFDSLWRRSSEPHVVLALAPSVAAALRGAAAAASSSSSFSSSREEAADAQRRPRASQDCFDAARSMVIDVSNAATRGARANPPAGRVTTSRDDPLDSVLGR